MKIHDISVKINKDLPVWPGSPGLQIDRLLDMEKGDEATVSLIHMEAHTGTHIDAPLHFVKGGKTITDIPLDKLIGDCLLVQIENCLSIGPLQLEKIPLDGVKKLLIKTDNQNIWKNSPTSFDESFAALSAEGAAYLVKKGIELVGIDYLSIQRFHDSTETHTILLENEVVILETLDLSRVTPGQYELLCLPLKIEGLEGCPVRAILREKV